MANTSFIGTEEVTQLSRKYCRCASVKQHHHFLPFSNSGKSIGRTHTSALQGHIQP
ncbi:MAG: hypothetical protein IPG00_02805 [Saprospiraceae bacterium]|nr:hypothetical protein [Saprospiraceae bacterium]